MEYTKDMIFNISYEDAQIARIKKEKTLKRFFNAICDNKFICIVLLFTFLLVIMDLIFVIKFINIVSMI